MQTWIKANIGRLKEQITNIKTIIGTPYENDNSIDTRLTALENAPAPVVADTIYSTTEQAVGQWVDGKTIYKKTIHAHSLTNEAHVDVTDPGDGVGSMFDTFVKYEVITSYVDNDYNISWTGPCGNDGKTAIAQKDNVFHNITIYFNNPHYITEVWFTIWYTKTPAPVETKKKR